MPIGNTTLPNLATRNRTISISSAGLIVSGSVIISGSANTITLSGATTTEAPATQTYVATQVSNLVDSAPTALDTLNELAAAIGDDANYASTISTALGNRLRIDTNSQGLTSTQQGYGRTNLGLGTAATSAASAFQTALTNPVTGTGNSTYIPKFNGTSTLTNSQIVDTGTYVGIGATSPGALLQVGNANQSTDALVRLSIAYSSDRASRGGITWRDASNTTGKIYTEYDGTMTSMVFGSLYNSGYTSNQTMIIRGNGNVGIATTTPVSKLEVRGTTTFSADAYGYVSIIPTAGNGGTAYITQGTNSPRNGGNLAIRVNSYGPQGGEFSIDTSGVQRFRITSAGATIITGSLTTTAGITSAVDVRAPIFYDSNDTNYYVNPASTSNLNLLTLAGDLSFGAQTGTWIASNAMADAIGWNTSYGVYIGSNTLGYSSYIRGDGTFTNNAGTYRLWHAGDFSSTNVSNWNTAYGWGNHASAGYLTSQTSHADVVVDGDFGSAGLMKCTGPGSYAIVTDNSSNWNTAYGWGNHASAGYLTSFSEADTLATVTGRGATTSTAITLSNSLTLAGFGTNSFMNGTGDGQSFSTYNFALSGWSSMAFYNPTVGGSFPNQVSGLIDFREGRINMKGDFRAPIFYDSDNTNYYVDPASTSRLNLLSLANKITVGSFANSTTNSGEAWIGRAADRVAGTLTVQLGTGTGRKFEVVDYGWTTVEFSADDSGVATAAGSFRAPIFYDSADTGYHWNPNTDNSHRFTTPSGYVDIGPKNSAYCHIYTDRTSFYFNKQLDVLGARVWHAGNDGAGTGLDADLLDGNHASAFATAAQGSNADTAYSWGNHTAGGYAMLDHIRSLGTTSFGGTATTAGLISEMENDGAFDSYTSVFKTSWSYAGNFDLSDAGRFTETAGSSWITWTDNSSDSVRGNITALVIAPSVGGSAGGVHIYNDQGSGYAPGWREVWTSATDGAGSGLDADLLDGNHASAFATAAQGAKADTAHGWGNHASAGYLTSVTNISGNAATATTAAAVTGLTITLAGNPANPNTVTQNQIGYNTSVSLFGQNDGGLYSSAYSSAWIHQIFGDFRSGQIAIRGKNNGTWQSWRTVLDSTNYSSYALPLGGGTMSGNIAMGGYSVTGADGYTGTNFIASNAFYLNGTSTFLNYTNGRVYSNSGFESAVNVVAPSFYDSNNTSYYIDPASTSNVNTLYGTEIYANNWFRNAGSNEGLYNQSTTQHWSSNTNGYWDASSTTGVTGIRLYASGHVNTLRGYLYSDGNGFGLLNNQGGWSVKCNQGTSYGGELNGSWTATGDLRAPIFYDSNNTSYYTDPAGNSLMRSLGVQRASIIGSVSAGPDPSALLELTSTTQGFLLPRMSKGDMLAITAPAPGLMVFETDREEVYVFAQGDWRALAYA